MQPYGHKGDLAENGHLYKYRSFQKPGSYFDDENQTQATLDFMQLKTCQNSTETLKMGDNDNVLTIFGSHH